MEIDAYLIFKAVAVAVFVLFGALAMHRRSGLSAGRALLITSIAVTTGFIASRAWYILQYFLGSEPYDPPDLAAAWNDAGSVLYGWILGAAAVVFLFSRVWKIPALKMGDALVPWALVAQFLNRLGCFRAGCCFGKPGHPVQLYEAAWDAFLLLVLWRMAGRTQGRATFLYFVGYAGGRFVLEFFRGDNQPALLGMTVPQIASVVIIFCAIILRQEITNRR